MPLRLAEATWTDVRDADARLAVLPVGSTEQHGPHAPLGTDAMLAETVAEAGAEAYEAGRAPDPEQDGDGAGRPGDDPDRTDGSAAASRDDPAGAEVLVAPTLPIGVSEEHRAFAGSLWFTPETFRATIRESVAALAHHGVEGIVVANGHGGNVEALGEACARLTRDGTAFAVPFTWFDAIDTPEPMGHAGPLETALLRATTDLVRDARVEEAREGGADRWGEWVSGTNLAYDSDEFTANGVVGDPTAGDAELGAELLAGAAAALADLLAAVAER